MTLALDSIGSRYGMLPSEVLVRASTLDLYIIDVAMTYEHHRQKKESGELTDTYSENQLLDIVNSVRGKNSG